MATAAFKSTTKRSPVDAGSTNREAGASRRSRSLSRFSGRRADEQLVKDRRQGFGKAEGVSGFPDVSLDDLADEFFAAAGLGDEVGRGKGGGRPGRRLSDAGFQMDTEASRRRGRSVSRKGGYRERSVGAQDGSGGSGGRRRSVSVVRHGFGDSEKATGHISHPMKSCSSASTDDDLRTVYNNNGMEKTTRTVRFKHKTDYSNEDRKGDELSQAMCKEVRIAVQELRTEFEKAIVRTKPFVRMDNDVQIGGSEVLDTFVDIRRNYTSKLEESEKRKQGILAELAAEEQRGHELTKLVRQLLPETEESSPPERSLLFGKINGMHSSVDVNMYSCLAKQRDSNLVSLKRSNSKTRMSKGLSEEANRYFMDFISNVEETDISSFDGDKSDGGSSIGGKMTKSSLEAGTQACPSKTFHPSETGGLILPWLDWETCSDSSPPLCRSTGKLGSLLTSGNTDNVSKMEIDILRVKELSVFSTWSQDAASDSPCLTSSHGSWSPDDNEVSSINSKNKQSSRVSDALIHLPNFRKPAHRVSSFRMDDYIHLQHTEEFLLEGLQQRRRIESGGLILCRNFLGH